MSEMKIMSGIGKVTISRRGRMKVEKVNDNAVNFCFVKSCCAKIFASLKKMCWCKFYFS